MILAKFIGKDGSMGFRNGKVYNIRTWVKRANVFTKTAWIWVEETDCGKKCPYTNVETFLANWEIVEFEYKP